MKLIASSHLTSSCLTVDSLPRAAMNRNPIAAGLIAALINALPTAALAEHVGANAPAGKKGDHPAIEVRRQLCLQGYDYASKFYPHPAWLYLYPEAPDAMVARSAAERAAVAKISESERLPQAVAARR